MTRARVGGAARVPSASPLVFCSRSRGLYRALAFAPRRASFGSRSGGCEGRRRSFRGRASRVRRAADSAAARPPPFNGRTNAPRAADGVEGPSVPRRAASWIESVRGGCFVIRRGGGGGRPPPPHHMHGPLLRARRLFITPLGAMAVARAERQGARMHPGRQPRLGRDFALRGGQPGEQHRCRRERRRESFRLRLEPEKRFA
jgi:hypothetical protein